MRTSATLPVVKIRRLRPSSMGVRGPLVAVTVPGKSQNAVALLLRVISGAIVRLPEREKIHLENIFFDFGTHDTSAEIVVSSWSNSLTIDGLAQILIDAVNYSANEETQVRSVGHLVGINTHRVQVIQ